MSANIYASKIVAEKLHAPNPPKDITVESKNSPGTKESYTRTYLSYNYGDEVKPYYSEPLFELNICKGRLKLNKKGVIKLNLTIKDQGDIAGLDQLSKGFALVVNKYKTKFMLKNFTPENPGELRGAYFHPVTEDGSIIAGSSPIVSLKMDNKTVFKSIKPRIDPTTKAPIMMPDGTPDFEEVIEDYKNLINKEIECSVIFSARDLYRSTGTPLPQMFVRSCIMFSVSAAGEVEHNKSAMVTKYLRDNPALLDTLVEQIARLKTGQSTSLLDIVKPTEQTNMGQSSPQTVIQAPTQSVSTQSVSTPSNILIPNLQVNPLQGLQQLPSTTPTIDLNLYLKQQQQQGQGQPILQRL